MAVWSLMPDDLYANTVVGDWSVISPFHTIDCFFDSGIFIVHSHTQRKSVSGHQVSALG